MRTFFLVLLVIASLSRAQAQYADWVNERIGTANEGQTFPSTGMPFATSGSVGNMTC
jgi:hypothetical protein